MLKDLLTNEQYEEQFREYKSCVKNNEITFFQFLTETHKVQDSELNPNKTMHKNSLEAYDKLDTSTRQRQVFEVIYLFKECTRQQIAIHLDWPINRVTGRVRELIDLDHITETGENVYYYDRPRSILKVTDHILERINKS